MPTHQLTSNTDPSYLGFNLINGDFHLDPEFNWGVKPPIPVRHANRPYPLAPSPVKLWPGLPTTAPPKSSFFDSPTAPMIAPSTFNMTETMQDGVNPDTHLRTQNRENPSHETIQDDITTGSTLQTTNTSGNPSSELISMVDSLLDTLSTRFATASTEILAKMDDMSRRLDNLEASILSAQTEKEPHQAA